VLKRKVAIKILSEALAHDKRGLRRFEQEACAASALNHPNILTVYEFGEFNGLHFIASEYIEGPTLRQKLAEDRLALAPAIDIAIQIARALDAAHSSQIVHRDIKPENVIIRADQLVKVLDFGIAKLSQSQTQHSLYPSALPLSLSISLAGLVIGSARYMSPEQARGQVVDPRSDIFSLGVVIYEMVSGNAPFDGQTVSDVIAEILKDTPPSLNEMLPGVLPELQEIVDKAMCKDRECRYQNVKDMLADLQEFAGQIQFQEKSSAAATGSGRDHPRALSVSARTGSPQTPSAESTARESSRRAFFSLAKWLVTPLLILVVALFGILYAGLFRKSEGTGTQTRPRSLAILPFRNLRQDPSLDYLGFSLADSVITKLRSVSALTVRPSSVVDVYRNQNVDLRKIGEQLNVDTLLIGGFIKDGDDLRITTQLIDLKPNRIIWRDSIDVKYDKLLTVQDRVSQEIVKGLELNLSQTEAQNLVPGHPVNSLAYEYYLRGIDLYSLNDFPAAIAVLEKSTSIDPNYAAAWAHLGKAYTTSASLRLGGREQYDKAQAAYEKAIALDPHMVEPRIFMANMLTDTGRVEQAVPLLRTVLQTSPNNAELHWELGYAYRFAGMLQESVAECEKARQIDPDVKINSSALNSYLYLGEFDKFLQSLPEKDSAYILFYRGLGEYYLNHTEQAAQTFDRAYTLEPSLLPARVGKALSYSIAGRHAAALQLLRQTEDEVEERGVSDAESMYKIAQAWAVLGDKSAALHALSHTIEGGFFCYACLVTDPLLASIRNESEFRRLSEEARQRHERFSAHFF
jgi:TolB-like protein/tetratricopeptide (TPR) repeat protein